MAQRTALILVLAMASLFVACDKQGVHPLGRDKDVIVQCDVQSTWIRSTEFMNDGGELVHATEVFIVGTQDFSTLDAQLADGVSVCFNFARVERDSNTKLWSGALSSNGGQYEVGLYSEYTFPYQPEVNIALRSGASRVDFDPLEVVPVAFTEDAGQLLLDYDGEARRLTRLGDVIARLNPDETDPEALGGPKDIYRMFNLGLFVGQPRIPGFGGTGMTKFDEKNTFTALISGLFTIVAKNLTDVYIEYFECEEIEGVVIDGLQITYANIKGEGTMTGILDFQLFSDASSDTPHITANVDYENLTIDRGVAGGGTYTLTVNPGQPNEHAAVLEYTMATDEDFAKSGLLPISEGLP